jgi:hypothetical protein
MTSIDEQMAVKQLEDFLAFPDENPPPQLPEVCGRSSSRQTAILEQYLAFLSSNIREEKLTCPNKQLDHVGSSFAIFFAVLRIRIQILVRKNP